MSGLRVLPVIDSRPPSVPWFAGLGRPFGVPAAQPSLLELSESPDRPSPGRDRHPTAAPGWQARPDPRLPEAGGWSASLGLAAVEVVRGRRPIGQLSRWVVEDQLDRLAALAARSSRGVAATAARARPVLQARVQSARVQHPTAEIAEAAVHVRIGPLSVPVALRLDAIVDRWLVTALEVGPVS